MNVTIPYIRQKYDEFNRLCFGGKLPSVPIRLSSARRYVGALQFRRKRTLFGKVEYSDFVLRISTRFDLSEAEVEDTILHEMIHCYIYSNGIRDTSAHGKAFRRVMQEINQRYGRHITISHRGTTTEQTDTGRRQAHIVCLSELADGKRGITVCARTRIFEIYRCLTGSRQVRHLSWYYTTDSFFGRFPNSRTAKVYHVADSELENHLKDAIELECDGTRMVRKKKATAFYL